MRSEDRIIKLSPIEGKATLSSIGFTDQRIFTGENNLHAVMEPNGLWSMHYERGFVEPALKVKFTNFPTLMKFLVDHYRKRNIKVTEVLD